MGNYCDPNSDYRVVNTENRSNVLGSQEYDLLKHDNDGTQRNNRAKNQDGNLKSANPEKLEKMTVPEEVDQEDKTGKKQQETNKSVVEDAENKPCEMHAPVDEQKEILVDCSEEPVQSLSLDKVFADEAQTESLQKVNQDIEEEIVVLEYVNPPDINNSGVQNTTTVSNFKSQKEISSPISVEHENKHIVKDIGRINELESSCLESGQLAEKKTTAEHNETAVKDSNYVTPSKGNTDKKDENLQEKSQLEEEPSKGNTVNKDENLQEQAQLREEAELLRRLENAISKKKKLVAEHNETLAQISKQKAERTKDLKSLENRIGTIKLQNELKERAYIVGSMEIEEKSCRTTTLNEGKLFKFGKGGLTYPKEKWVQLRLFPKGQVILEYAELCLSAKVERNHIISVERGEKYLRGNSSPYNGRVFAVRTTSTGKHSHMVFAAESKELCGEWIECVKRAFA